jgi:hypothetical protein
MYFLPWVPPESVLSELAEVRAGYMIKYRTCRVRKGFACTAESRVIQDALMEPGRHCLAHWRSIAAGNEYQKGIQ